MHDFLLYIHICLYQRAQPSLAGGAEFDLFFGGSGTTCSLECIAVKNQFQHKQCLIVMFYCRNKVVENESCVYLFIVFLKKVKNSSFMRKFRNILTANDESWMKANKCTQFVLTAWKRSFFKICKSTRNCSSNYNFSGSIIFRLSVLVFPTVLGSVLLRIIRQIGTASCVTLIKANRWDLWCLLCKHKI